MRRLRAGLYKTLDGRFWVECGQQKPVMWALLDQKLGHHRWFDTLADAREYIAARWRSEAAKRKEIA